MADLPDLRLVVAPRAILALGEDLVRDDRAALEELVKNSYDADAREVRVIFTVEDGRVTALSVRDDGVGMSLSDIQSRWLVVATANKIKRKKSAKGRVLTGEKGIGRLATARLGSGLEMATRTRRGRPLILELDWSGLSRVPTLDQFPIAIQENAERLEELGVEDHGTCIRLTHLHHDWQINEHGGEEIDALEQALTKVVNPFSRKTGIRLYVAAEGDFSFERELGPSSVVSKPHYVLKGEVSAEGHVSATYESLAGKKNRQKVSIPSESTSTPLSVKACGPFAFEIRAWDREARILTERAGELGISASVGEMREALDQANGFFVYRDDFLVVPKREEDKDWLGLEARRVDDPSKRLGLSQLVAAAYISRDENPELRDKSDREGLLDNAGSRQFRAALLELVGELAVRRNADKPAMGTARAQPQGEVHIARLLEAAQQLLQGEIQPKEVVKIIKEESARLEATRTSLRSRLASLGRLATVGHLAGVLVHELGRSTPILGESVKRLMQGDLGTGKAEAILDRAQDAVRSIQRVIQRFAPFFVGGVRTRRRGSDLLTVVSLVVDLHQADLRSKRIEAEVKVPENLTLDMDPGDLVAVLSNLVDNAVYWCQQADRPRAIRIFARAEDDHTIVRISDSGPGIEEDLLERVFEPGFTLKRHGMGLGLAIVRDILESYGYKVEARSNSKLGGASLELSLGPRMTDE